MPNRVKLAELQARACRWRVARIKAAAKFDVEGKKAFSRR
jgi:hypothetical protein